MRLEDLAAGQAKGQQTESKKHVKTHICHRPLALIGAVIAALAQ